MGENERAAAMEAVAVRDEVDWKLCKASAIAEMIQGAGGSMRGETVEMAGAMLLELLDGIKRDLDGR